MPGWPLVVGALVLRLILKYPYNVMELNVTRASREASAQLEQGQTPGV